MFQNFWRRLVIHITKEEYYDDLEEIELMVTTIYLTRSQIVGGMFQFIKSTLPGLLYKSLKIKTKEWSFWRRWIFWKIHPQKTRPTSPIPPSRPYVA